MKLKIFIFLLLSTILISGCKNKNQESLGQKTKKALYNPTYVDETTKTAKMCDEVGKLDAKAFSNKYNIPIDHIDGEIAEEASRGGRFGKANPRLILQLVCYTGVIPFDFESVVEDTYNNWKKGIVKELDLCDYTMSGSSTSICASRANEVDKKDRELKLKELEGRLGNGSSQLLREAYDSAVKFIEAKAYLEEGHDGSSVGAMIIASEMEQQHAYLQLISKIIDGFKPTVSNDFDKTNQKLNKTYKELIEGIKVMDGSVRLLPSVAALQINQNLWTRYRDASVKLFKSINPSVDTDLWKSWLTEQREGELNAIFSLFPGGVNPHSIKANLPSPIGMVYVEGGCFEMGEGVDADELPVHEVCVDDFSIGRYEVTQKEWKAVMGNNPSYFKGCDLCFVEQVSWNDVQKFIKKLNSKTGKNYRLPTEAEWEYAARDKGSKIMWAGTNDRSKLVEYAWYSGIGSHIHPVGQKKPNALGLYDMSGNAREWVHDWYGKDYYGKSLRNNPHGPSSGDYRVQRGGSSFDKAKGVRVANRDRTYPDYSNQDIGFRLSMSPQDK